MGLAGRYKGVRGDDKRWTEGLPGKEERHTMLDPGFLGLVHEELLQFLLVGRGELREVGLALSEAGGGVHGESCVYD